MTTSFTGRILVGFCPNCGAPHAIRNNGETWALAECGHCDWSGDMDELGYALIYGEGSVSSRYDPRQRTATLKAIQDAIRVGGTRAVGFMEKGRSVAEREIEAAWNR